jgi:hypothetical protein
MSKRKKTGQINTNGGANVGGNIHIDGQGTFVGRDQTLSSDSKSKLGIAVPVIVAVITVIGAVIVAIINYSAEIDKTKLDIQMTKTAQVITPTASSTLTPQITETAISSPLP